jgi:tetratricopeptide (TPR) repeat protein
MRWAALGLVWLALVSTAAAVDDPPLPVPDLGGAVSAQARFNEGRALAEARDWPAAERKYREAIELDPALPEPWNGLGYALRQQRRWDESVKAYLEALRLRPSYPQALEYLGHAYVEMGRLDDARAVLARLRPLDPAEADELAQAITRAARR